MKVIHFSSLATGGAGIAAGRIHRGLRDLGIESRYGTLDGPHPSQNGCFRVPKRYLRWYEQAAWKLGIALNETLKRQQDRARLDLGGAAFSWPGSDHDLWRLAESQDADAIHLHWTSDLLDWTSFFQTATKPIFWTLHDMNPFMGGFHYECDRSQASSDLIAEDTVLRDQKRTALQHISDEQLVCVSPSEWLKGETSKSAMLGRFRHRVIPNGIDTEIFRPLSREFSREVLGLPKDHKLLLVIAEQLKSYRKGSDLLVEALKIANLPGSVAIAVAGSGEFSAPGVETFAVGRISDERLLALLYSAADLLILPTREDNLPNVMIEALACGTPVVGTPVGGISEAVKDGFNGVLADEATPPALATAIQQALESEFNLESIRQDAVKRFDVSVAAARYKALYEEVLKAS